MVFEVLKHILKCRTNFRFNCIHMASSSSSLTDRPNLLQRVLRFIYYPCSLIANKILTEIHILEQFFIKLYNMYAFVSQMFFFVACAIAFHETQELEKHEELILIGLKTLLFYSVFAYFVTKSRNILSTDERRSFFQNWTVAEGICRVVIEWGKAIIVVACLREQGIYFNPTFQYATLTLLYYMCTERIFTELILKAVQHCAFESLDNLEHLYVPLALNIYTVSLSLSIQLYLAMATNFRTFTLLCFYFTVYLRLKDGYINYWRIVKVAQEIFEQFRSASQEELEEYDDICAVCLNRMSTAKVTPCNHFFHPNCLKECLKNSLFCPICKYNF